MEGGASSFETRVFECLEELPLHSRQKQHITHQKDIINGEK